MARFALRLFAFTLLVSVAACSSSHRLTDCPTFKPKKERRVKPLRAKKATGYAAERQDLPNERSEMGSHRSAVQPALVGRLPAREPYVEASIDRSEPLRLSRRAQRSLSFEFFDERLAADRNPPDSLETEKPTYNESRFARRQRERYERRQQQLREEREARDQLNEGPTGRVNSRGRDRTDRQALAGGVIGILSLLFGFSFAIAGLILSILGRKSVRYHRLAKAGYVISIIVLALIMLNLFSGSFGLLFWG